MKKLRINKTNEIVYYERLSTGLDVYMYPNDNVQSFYLTYNIKFGSIDTTVKVDNQKKAIVFPHGTAHFLEHQLFQNDNDTSAFEEFARLGSSVNAYTSYTTTCYEVIGSSLFKENLETLFKFVNTPYFQEKSIENERKIIESEIGMYKDAIDAVSNYGLEEILNIQDEHKYTISGRKEDIAKIDKDVLYKAYEIFYNHENSFLVLTGAFKPLEAIGILKELIKMYPSIPVKKINRIKKREPIKVCDKIRSIKMKSDKTLVNYAYKINKRPLKKYDEFLLNTYINLIMDLKFSTTSDFYERVIDGHIINGDFSYSVEIRDDYIKASFKYKTDYVDESINLIRQVLLENDIIEKDLNRMRKVYIASYIRLFNDNVSIQEAISSDILMNSKVNLDIISDYEKLNLKTLYEIYNLLNFSCYSVYTITNE